jgi:hypothetical protein
MIKLEQPSLAINTFDVPGPNYRMDQTVKLNKYASAIVLVSEISSALRRNAQSDLKNVVINCHGSPGYLYIGEIKVKVSNYLGKLDKERDVEGIGIEHVGLFTCVKGRIGTIWIAGCQVAGVSGVSNRSGNNFCPQLAMAAGCNVVAANVSQYVNPGYYLRLLPKNCIDNYEGTAYRWDANGKREVFKQGLI